MAWIASDTPCIQAIFSCEFARYLGRISFALYLVHAICIHVIALWLIPTMWELTGKDTRLKFELGFFLATSIHVPITFFAADLFTKVFDDTSVRFAKWVEGKLDIDGSENVYQPVDSSSLPLTQLVFSLNGSDVTDDTNRLCPPLHAS
jgi:peptidoglycan/LPS O-acetylase OafA/YrhL